VPACPAGWLIGPPDFVGVGAQRAGGSWWFSMITAHPEVSVLPGTRQEVHFFDLFWDGRFGADDVDRYHSYFPREPGTLTGEWTPRYMYDAWTPALLARAAPDVRLLVMLRDPVERYRRQLAKNPEASRSGSATGLQVAADALARSLYAPQLRRLLRHFPRERVLILQFESCVLQAESRLRETYEFLGLDSSFVPPDLVPWDGEQPPPALSPALEAELCATYADEMPALLELAPGLDPGLWQCLAPAGRGSRALY